jgi:hypothetical protein
MILETDPRILSMQDCRKFLPLDYVPEIHWKKWINFLERTLDEYWPQLYRRYSKLNMPFQVDSHNFKDKTFEERLPEIKVAGSQKMAPDEATQSCVRNNIFKRVFYASKRSATDG